MKIIIIGAVTLVYTVSFSLFPFPSGIHGKKNFWSLKTGDETFMITSLNTVGEVTKPVASRKELKLQLCLNSLH